MLNHTFTFNGRCSDEFGVKIERMPNLNRSARKFRSSSVPGRNGAIYELENAWEEVTISYEIFAGGNKAGDAVSSFTEIVEWLNSADDYAELSDTYDPDHYRMAVFVDAIEIESFWHRHGRATVTFRCTPQRYLASGAQVTDSGDTVYNPTNHIAKPIITLTGDGIHSLFQVDKELNDVSVTNQRSYNERFGNYIGWVSRTLNSELQRLVINFYAISSGGSTGVQDAALGQLVFRPYQSGSVYCGLGTAVEVVPGAYYRLACNAMSTGQNKISIYFFHGAGAQLLLDTSFTKTQSGAGEMAMIFKVPNYATHALIVFERPDGTVGTFRVIMLSPGIAVRPFRPYMTSTINTFILGSRGMEFDANGFDTAVIDCERENIAIDGVDANMNVTLIDDDGNPIVEFLQLDKGPNRVAYTSAITSAIIDPRLWEL